MALAQAGHAWLPLDRCLSWVKVAPETAQADDVELARRAAAAWCESKRPDLTFSDAPEADPVVVTFHADDQVVLAGVLATARLVSRKGSPSGLVAYTEFAASVLRIDPDVTQLLGVDADSRTPRVG